MKRRSSKDEKPADKAKIDKDFKQKQQQLEVKLTQEKALGKCAYPVADWTVDSLLNKRFELLVEKR